MSHDENKTFSICYIKKPMTFFQGASEIIIVYPLLLPPLIPESFPIFVSLIYEDYCNAQGFLLSKLFLTLPGHSQLINSLFKI